MIGVTVTGAGHRRLGQPNQDAVACLPTSGRGERVVAAVSDGHGTRLSPRSARGARLAVEVATRVLWSMLPDGDSALDAELLRLATGRIVAEWTAQVLEHHARQPLGAAEAEAAVRAGARGGGTGAGGTDDAAEAAAPTSLLERWRQRPTLAYGATLLFAVVDGDRVGVGQLGDGDVLLVAADGSVRRALPHDERLVAHATTSLCGPDPVRETRIAVIDEVPALVMVSTDGYANSFADDAAFRQVGGDLLTAVREHGLAEVGRRLPEWLAETSAQGAGDDISVALALTALARAGGGRPQVHPVRLPGSSPRRRPPDAAPAAASPRRPAGAGTPRTAPGVLDTITEVAVPDLSVVHVAGPALEQVAAPGAGPRRPTWWPWLAGALAAVVVAAAVGAAVALRHRLVPAGPTATASPSAAASMPGGPFTAVPRRPDGRLHLGQDPSSPQPAWAFPSPVTVQRQSGNRVDALALDRPMRSRVIVTGGLLVLLDDGRFTRLPASGPLQPSWTAVPGATEFAEIVASAGRRVLPGTRLGLVDAGWRLLALVDPGTGQVVRLDSSGAPLPEPTPSSTSPSPHGSGRPSPAAPNEV